MPFLYIARCADCAVPGYSLEACALRRELKLITKHCKYQVFFRKKPIFSLAFCYFICSSFAIFSPLGISFISSVVITRSLMTATA